MVPVTWSATRNHFDPDVVMPSCQQAGMPHLALPLKFDKPVKAETIQIYADLAHLQIAACLAATYNIYGVAQIALSNGHRHLP